MRNLFAILLLPIAFFLSTCTGDITGPAGKDAALSPLIRIHRPGYRSVSTTTIAINGTATNPIVFKFGSDLVTSEKNLYCNISQNGVGGLRDGLTASASSIYYLYGVRDGSGIGLVADTKDPNTGPSGYTDWTYIGAFATNASSNVVKFISSRGFFRSAENMFESAAINTLQPSATKATVSPCPTTIQFHYGYVIADGGTQDAWSNVFPTDVASGTGIEARIQTNNATNEQEGVIPALSGTDVYLAVSNSSNTSKFVSLGWIEDPMEYQ